MKLKSNEIPFDLRKAKNLKTPNADNNVEQQELSYIAYQSIKWHIHALGLSCSCTFS